MSKTKKEILEGIPSETIGANKKIANNTLLINFLDGSQAVRLHNTNVVMTTPSGSIILDSGGWMTPTTKDRINNFSPYTINQRKNIWYVNINGTEYIFNDGMKISKRGKVTGATPKNNNLERLDKKISVYVKGYMQKLINRELEKPSGGDCWFCALGNKDGSLGELSHDKTHIKEHMKSKYYVPSLLIRATDKIPISQVAKHCLGYWFKYHDERAEHYEDIAKSQIEKSLKRYLRSQLGLAR